MMRFQPSWILESLPPEAVASIFLPLSPRPHSLLWFKRLGIRIFANDPVESRAMLLRVLLGSDSETLSDQNRRKFNRIIKKPLEMQMNPFRTWENRPFSTSQLDYLFYWREAAFEISETSQREIFWSAVYGVMAYWLTMLATGMAPAFPPDELLGFMLRRREERLVPGQEKVYPLHMPIDELGEEVEAELFAVPLLFQGRKPLETDHDVMFHAWFRGNPDLHAAVGEIDNARKGWVYRWREGCDARAMLTKAGKASYAAFTWSGADLSPLWHEEHVARCLRETFASRFPKSVLRIKASDAARDDFDFLLTMAAPGHELSPGDASTGVRNQP